MTVLKKMSDRDGFIFDVIKILGQNKLKEQTLNIYQLQNELLQCGVYVKIELLRQIISVMMEKGSIKKPTENAVPQNVPEESKAAV